MMTMKAAIIHIVEANQGIKATELIMKVMAQLNPVTLSNKEYDDTIKMLVENGDIIEIEYVLPQMTYRIKSMYFPKGTTFNIEGYLNGR